MMLDAFKQSLAAVSRRDLFWFAISFMNVSLALAVLPVHAAA